MPKHTFNSQINILIMHFRLIISLFLVLASCQACGPGPSGSLPDFNLLLPDSSIISISQIIPKGKPVILLFVSPDCEYCQAETKDLLDHIDSLRDTRICFATIDPFPRLKVFNEYYNLSKYSNVIAGRDYSFFLPKYYQIEQPPCTFVYDSQKRLKMAFEGGTTARQILKTLNGLQ